MRATTRTIWKTMCIIRDEILNHNGLIFGGFVRDMIIHDYNATLFYDRYSDKKEAAINYADKSIHPDTWDRTLIPRDIDCVIDREQFDKFHKILKKLRLKLTVKKTISPTDYLDNFLTIPGNTVSQHLCIIEIDNSYWKRELSYLPLETHALEQMLMQKMEYVCIKMDCMVTEKPVTSPFLGSLDFVCNGLYLSKHGFGVSQDLCSHKDHLGRFNIIHDIVEDIKIKRAVFLQTSAGCGSRTAKLFNRGWKIEDDDITTMDEEYEGHCIMCHDSVPRRHFKLKCCDCRYHAKCLERHLDFKNGTVKECVMCKCPCDLNTHHQRLFACVDVFGDENDTV